MAKQAKKLTLAQKKLLAKIENGGKPDLNENTLVDQLMAARKVVRMSDGSYKAQPKETDDV